jgi:hypothetical protein
MPGLKPANDNTAPRETPSAFWPAPKMQMSRQVYRKKAASPKLALASFSSRCSLRSVLPLAHLSAFSAAQETQIEFTFFFFSQVSRCQTPSAFPEAAKM